MQSFGGKYEPEKVEAYGGAESLLAFFLLLLAPPGRSHRPDAGERLNERINPSQNAGEMIKLTPSQSAWETVKRLRS
jgi:hypothetical protein